MFVQRYDFLRRIVQDEKTVLDLLRKNRNISGSKLCKKYPRLIVGCYMFRPQDIEKVLRGFPAEDVLGIGRRGWL